MKKIVPTILYLKKDCDNCRVFIAHLETQLPLYPFVLLIPVDFTTLSLDTQEVLQSRFGTIPLPSLQVRNQIHKGISPEDDLSSIFLNAMVDDNNNSHHGNEILTDHMLSHEIKYALFIDHFFHHFMSSYEKEWMPSFFVATNINELFKRESLLELLKHGQNPSIVLTNVKMGGLRRKAEIDHFWDMCIEANIQVYHVDLHQNTLLICHPLFYLHRTCNTDFCYGHLTLNPSRVKFSLLTTFMPLLSSSRMISKKLRPLNRRCSSIAAILELIKEL